MIDGTAARLLIETSIASVQRFRGAHRRLTLGPAATAGLHALARGHRTSLYTVLLAGFLPRVRE